VVIEPEHRKHCLPLASSSILSNFRNDTGSRCRRNPIRPPCRAAIHRLALIPVVHVRSKPPCVAHQSDAESHPSHTAMIQAEYSLPAALRKTRTIWTFLLLWQFLYMVWAWRIIQRAQPVQFAESATTGMARVALAILMVSILTLALALYFHLKLVRSASLYLQTNPDDATAIANWYRGKGLSMLLAEGISLLGFLLLFAGAPLNRAAVPYIIGTIATLLFFPKNPAKI